MVQRIKYKLKTRIINIKIRIKPTEIIKLVSYFSHKEWQLHSLSANLHC